jgi:hypothetical protein
VGLRDSSVFKRTGWPDDRLTGMRLVFLHQKISQESFFEEMSFMIWVMSLKVSEGVYDFGPSRFVS